MKKFFEAPDRYDYQRRTNPKGFGESAIALSKGEKGVVLGISNVRELNIPLVPEGFKAAIQEIRMRRAEVDAARRADAARERAKRIWLMSAH